MAVVKFDDDCVAELLSRIADGDSLRTIAKDARMPAPSTFMDWVRKDPELAERYARAREIGMDAIGEEILEIVDSSTPETAVRDRLRYDARRWYLSKLAPKKYGEKVQHTGADGDGPVQIEHSTAAREVETRLKRLGDKSE